MFSSDVTARGMDYPDVTLVLQVDELPCCVSSSPLLCPPYPILSHNLSHHPDKKPVIAFRRNTQVVDPPVELDDLSDGFSGVGAGL